MPVDQNRDRQGAELEMSNVDFSFAYRPVR
jgi:hypothetical protein